MSQYNSLDISSHIFDNVQHILSIVQVHQASFQTLCYCLQAIVPQVVSRQFNRLSLVGACA